MGIKNYTKEQWCILFIYSAISVLGAFSNSIRGPFYPIVAEEKGASPSQYGIVFGVFSLMMFLTSPLYGKMIPIYGSKFICNTGIFLLGATNILFEFLYMVDGVDTFIGLSIAVRVVEGFGHAAFRCGSLSIVANQFSGDVESGFAILQSSFTVGFILGPIIGGALFELGGFMLPFLIIGILLLCSFCGLLCIPKNYFKQEFSIEKSNLGYYDILKLPAVLIAISANIGSYMNLGFILAFLEPHVFPLNLTPTEIGFLYVTNAVAYSISTYVWGKLCNCYLNPHCVWSIGALLTIIGMILLGPAPYLPFQINIYSCVIALFIHGLGESAEVVAAFSGMNKAVAASGFPVDLNSHGLVSTLFTTSFSVALFIGPTIGGLLYESVGFPWTSHVYALYHLLLILVSIIHNQFFRNVRNSNIEFKSLQDKNEENSYRNFE